MTSGLITFPEPNRLKIRLGDNALVDYPQEFVSILSKAGHCKACPPITIPEGEKWFVRIMGSKDRFVFGEYRPHMKTIDYLGQLDELFGAPATTRNWNTILSVLRILRI